MAVRLMAWNVKDRLGDPDKAPILFNAIEREKPDVAAFSEAYAEGADIRNATESLEKLGYLAAAELYDDAPGRKGARNDRHGLILAINKKIMNTELWFRPIRLATRTAIQATVVDPQTGKPMNITHAHMDDRSWKARNAMLQAYRWQTPTNPDGGVKDAEAFLTDANSADRDDPFSKTMRRVQWLRPIMYPLYKEPDPTTQQSKLIRKISLGYRTIDMGRDDIVDQFAAIQLRDADPTHVPTIPAEDPKMRLDHIFVSPHIHVLSNSVGDYNAAADHGKYNPASDHLYIISDVSVAR